MTNERDRHLFYGAVRFVAIGVIVGTILVCLSRVARWPSGTLW